MKSFNVNSITKKVVCMLVLMAMIITMMPTNANAQERNKSERKGGTFVPLREDVILDSFDINGNHEVFLVEKRAEYEGNHSLPSSCYYWEIGDDDGENTTCLLYSLTDLNEKGEEVHGNAANTISYSFKDYGRQFRFSGIITQEDELVYVTEQVTAIDKQGKEFYGVYAYYLDKYTGKKNKAPYYAALYVLENAEKNKIIKDFFVDCERFVPDKSAYAELYLGKSSIYVLPKDALNKKELNVYKIVDDDIVSVEYLKASYDKDGALIITGKPEEETDYVLLGKNAKEEYAAFQYGIINGLQSDEERTSSAGIMTSSIAIPVYYDLPNGYEQASVTKMDMKSGAKIRVFILRMISDDKEYIINLQKSQTITTATFSMTDKKDKTLKNELEIKEINGELGGFKQTYSNLERKTNNTVSVINSFNKEGMMVESAHIEGTKGTSISKEQLDFIKKKLKGMKGSVEIDVKTNDAYRRSLYSIRTNLEALKGRKKLHLVNVDGDKYKEVGSAKYRIAKDGSLPLTLTASKNQKYILAEDELLRDHSIILDAGNKDVTVLDFAIGEGGKYYNSTEKLYEYEHNDGTTENLTIASIMDEKGNKLSNEIVSEYHGEDGKKFYIAFVNNEDNIGFFKSKSIDFKEKRYNYLCEIYIERESAA